MINDTELEMVLRAFVESSARQGTTLGHLSRGTAKNQESIRIAYIQAEILDHGVSRHEAGLPIIRP